MKKIILIASMLLMFVITLPVLAEEAHHPEHQAAQVTAQMNTENMDASMQQMQGMRKKIEMEKDPAVRKELIHQHLQMMRDGMNMMTMMGGQAMMMGKDTSAIPMDDRMKMMEKKMAMMGKMMGGQCMMMGGTSGKPMDDRIGMMEKKTMMLQEILNGMMTQQEMMMK